MNLIQMKFYDRPTTWCVKASGVGDGEFTVCGYAYTDSRIETFGVEATGKTKTGNNPTCKECKKIIKWYKDLT